MKKIFHKITALIVGIIVVCTCCMNVYASNSINLTDKTIKVGFFQFDGYHNISENGVYSGYGYDFLQKMRLYADWKYEYVGYEDNWSTMLEMLEDGEIDVLTSAQKTPEREQLFDFSDKPIGTSAAILTVKSGSEKFVQGDYSTYDGMRVGIIDGNSRNDSFYDFATEKGFTYTTVSYNDVDDMTADLQNGGKIDGIVTSNLRSVENEWVLDQFDSSDFYAMVKKGNKEALDVINYAIGQMDKNSPDWRSDLFNRYYTPKSGEEISFSQAELNYLKDNVQNGVVYTAVVNPDRYPYSYFENGVAKGIMVEAFAQMASRIGLEYEVVPVKDRAEYNDYLTSGQADIWIDACYDYYLAENRGYVLTTPYLHTTISRIAYGNNKISQNPKIAALKNADLTRQYYDVLYPDKSTVLWDSLDDCVDALKNGDADYTYAYTYTAQKIVVDDPTNRLSATLLPDYGTQFAVGISENQNHCLTSIIDKCSKSLTEGYMQSLSEKYTDYSNLPVSFVGLIYKYPTEMILVLLSILALILVVIYSRIKVANDAKHRKQQDELVRFMGYVCKANEMVLEVNLKTFLCKRYYLGEDDNVHSVQEEYRQKNGNNYNDNIYPEDFIKINEKLDEKKIDEMIENQTGKLYFECRTKDKNGEYLWYAYTLQPLPKTEEHPRNFILFKKNIDSLKREEEKKKQVLEDALELARNASEAKGTFLSRMSHEIRTPLNAVIGYLSIAKMPDSDLEKINHCIDNGELAAKHLLNIINDVLDISSIESGKIKIAHESFDFKNLLTTVSTIFYNQSKDKNINFSVAIHDLTVEWLIGDSLRVNQILMNLLSNAMKFTMDNGKVSLVVTQMLDVQQRVHMKFEVSDTGIGMSEEMLTRLFKPFEQENAQIAQKFGGTGLGLSITKNLVTMMGGSIEVKSEQGKGTTFTVLLPFSYSEENDKDHEIQHDFSKVRALVVDDEQSDCEYIKSLLKRCGVKSDTVFNGESAVKKIRIRQQSTHPYDLCIMDWNMPGQNGVETAKKIHEECAPDLPIIIATAYDVSGISSQAKEVGVSTVISKPLFQSTMFNLLVNTYGKYQAVIPKDKELIDMSGISILLVEDNEMNMEIAVDILKKSGLDITTAMDGKQALDIFTESKPGTYQAILMDIQMPIMDGYTATKAIRASSHPEADNIPIIAMTANAFSEDVAEALACGMNDHISKPISYEKLFNTLEKLIKKVRQ